MLLCDVPMGSCMLQNGFTDRWAMLSSDQALQLIACVHWVPALPGSAVVRGITAALCAGKGFWWEALGQPHQFPHHRQLVSKSRLHSHAV